MNSTVRRKIRVIIALLTLVLLNQRTFAAIVIETVPVGDAGNADDGINHIGTVGYDYNIGKYEVTVGQYTAFLNAVAATDTYNLYSQSMAPNLMPDGIIRSGASGSYTYSISGSVNKPVSNVSWGDAARFSNWMQNGQPTGFQTVSTTEDGAYLLNGATTDVALMAVTRKSNAIWFVPTLNEWHKAAYYQPASRGGPANSFWNYTTRSNTLPNSDKPPGERGTRTNVANAFRDDGVINDINDGYAATGFTVKSSFLNMLTDVGAYTFAPGPYGTFDQGGNVQEWTETTNGPGARSLRGGSWESTMGALARLSTSTAGPSFEQYDTGFRIASIPEPNSIALLLVGVSLFCWNRFRFTVVRERHSNGLHSFND